MSEIEPAHSEEVFRNFFENSVIGMSMTSLDGQLRMNKAFCDMLGYSQDELSAINWRDLTHPEDIRKNELELDSILSGMRSSSRWQKRYYHKNRSIVWADISTAIQRDSESKPQFFITTVTDITQQVKLQDSLAENELRLRESQSIANLGTYNFHLKTGFWTSSEILNDIFGINKDYKRSFDGWVQIIHPDWRQEMVDYVNQEFNGKRGRFDKEYKIVKVNNQEERWVHGSGILAFDQEGNPVRLIGTITDISSRKNEEIAVNEGHERLKRERNAIAAMAVDEAIASGDIPVTVRRITELVSAVMQVERASIWLLSEDRDQLKCLSLYEAGDRRRSEGAVLWSADYPKYFAALNSESSISAGDARTDQRTSEFTGGYLIPLGITSLLDTSIIIDGEMAGVICLEHTGNMREWKSDEEAFVSTMASLVAQAFVNDKRRKSEELLRDSEERYRLLMETLPDSVIVHQDGRIVFANTASARVMGANSPAELVGLPVMQVVHPAYKEMAIEQINSSHKYGTFLAMAEEKLVRLDGTIIDVAVTAIPISFDGEPAMLTVTDDITERKLASRLLQEKSEYIQAQSEEFRQLNEELTQTNEALHHAKIKAEESDRLKTVFLANMSHEIRTPLNSIIGFSELLGDGDNCREEVVRYSSIIQTSGNRLLELISHLIDISKIESGTETVRIGLFSPASTIREVVRQFHILAERKSIKIIENIPDEVKGLAIHSDSLKLHQILTNLINNALKFTSRGAIEVGMEGRTEGILFYVKDTGIGIPESHQKRIFDRFYQVDSRSSREYEGAGLGLSLCKGIVDILGGKIWVESEPGKGSAFFFILPDSKHHRGHYADQTLQNIHG